MPETPETRWRAGLLTVQIAVVCAATAGYFLYPLSMPPGYFTDALSNVINAVYIHEFGKDEYGVAYPLVGFRSFGDYKPPLFMYMCSFLMTFFEPSVAMARLMGMIAGWLGIAITVATARRLIGRAVYAWTWAPLGALALLSSWVLVPQRISMEMTLVILVISLLIAATLALVRDPGSLAAGLAMGFSWGLMPYVYHSTKFLFFFQIPMVLAALLLTHGRQAWRYERARGLYLALLVGGCMGAPMIFDLLGNRTSLARFYVVGSANSVGLFVERFFLHLGPGFLFLTGDANPRHHSGFLGMLNAAFMPLLPMGLLMAAKYIRQRSGAHLYLLLSLLVGLAPVCLTNEGLPHALRTLNIVPPLLLLSFLGAEYWWELTVRTGMKWTGVALALATAVSGGWLAGENLQTYFSNPPAKEAWVYFGPEAGWLENEKLYGPHDHSPRSVAYRYYRIVEMEDFRFRD